MMCITYVCENGHYNNTHVSTIIHMKIAISVYHTGKKNPAIWVKSLNLTVDNRECILKGKKLDDRVINAAQALIKKQFPEQNGLRDTVILEGANLWDDEPQHFVQIMFDRNRKHWVCVSNKFADDIVEIYDTLPPKKFTVSKSIMRQVATVLKTKEDSFKVRSVETPIHF